MGVRVSACLSTTILPIGMLTLVVKAYAVTTMLILVHVRNINPEERVGQVARAGGIRKIDVDYERCEGREQEVPAPGAHTAECVLWPDDAVAIFVPVGAVLLHDGHVFVALHPVLLLCAFGRLFRGGDVGAGGAGVLEAGAGFRVVG